MTIEPCARSPSPAPQVPPSSPLETSDRGTTQFVHPKLTMSRYYFDVHDGTDAIDDEGTELPDLEAARAYAHRVSVEFGGSPRMLRGNGGAVVVIARNEAGETVVAVRLALSVEAA